MQSWMNTQNHFVFLQSCWLAQSYFAEHSNPMSHHPLRKKKKKCISDCQEPSDSRKNTSFSGFVSHISSHDTFFFFLMQQRVQISKDGFLIISSQPEKERKIEQKSAGEMCFSHYPQLPFTILFLILSILCQLTLLFWQKSCLCKDQELKLNPSLNFPVITLW